MYIVYKLYNVVIIPQANCGRNNFLYFRLNAFSSNPFPKSPSLKQDQVITVLLFTVCF